MDNKKAQGLSLNTIIIAVIVLVVLVVLIVIFSGKLGDFNEVSNCPGDCKKGLTASCDGARRVVMDCDKDKGLDTCCIPDS